MARTVGGTYPSRSSRDRRTRLFLCDTLSSAKRPVLVELSRGQTFDGAEMKRAFSESESDDGDYNDEEQELSEATENGEASARKKRRGLIEKKRRDRINTCLAELRRLVPAAVERQGSTKLEKAEILQLTVEHLKAIKKAGVTGQKETSVMSTMDYHTAGFQQCMAETARFLYSMDIEPHKSRRGADQANNGTQQSVASHPTQKSIGLTNAPITLHGPIQDIWAPQSYNFLGAEASKADCFKDNDASLKLELTNKNGLSNRDQCHLSPQGRQFPFPAALKHPAVLPLRAPDMTSFQLSLLSPAIAHWPFSVVTKSNMHAPPALFGPWAPQLLDSQT